MRSKPKPFASLLLLLLISALFLFYYVFISIRGPSISFKLSGSSDLDVQTTTTTFRLRHILHRGAKRSGKTDRGCRLRGETVVRQSESSSGLPEWRMHPCPAPVVSQGAAAGELRCRAGGGRRAWTM